MPVNWKKTSRIFFWETQQRFRETPCIWPGLEGKHHKVVSDRMIEGRRAQHEVEDYHHWYWYSSPHSVAAYSSVNNSSMAQDIISFAAFTSSFVCLGIARVGHGYTA